MSGLQVIQIVKAYDGKPLLQGISFEVAPGEIMALLGSSGSGKSTLLGIIAGLQPADGGEVRWDGQSLEGVAAHRRGFGVMFQDYMLFPHMSVFANVAFGLRMAKWPAQQIQARVAEVLTLVGLPDYQGRDVLHLSGGEQQRVALARSLAPRPRLLLLDEPLGAVDRLLRDKLLVELGQILRQTRQTAVYVTHDQEEAFVIADRVTLLQSGRAAQVGAPVELYQRPASAYVARFLGLDNLLPGRLGGGTGGWRVETALGDWELDDPGLGAAAQPGLAVTVLLRPDALRLDGAGPQRLRARLEQVFFRGSRVQALATAGGVRLSIDLSAGEGLPAPGGELDLSFDTRRAVQVFLP
jgi:ABC-type Fe3+/spermidine/putrescine transport system ATPase subunit